MTAPSGPGARRPGHSRRPLGFTLIELLVVVAIIAFATAGVGLALRDPADAQLEREGLRLTALLESARQQARTAGVPVRWRNTQEGFRFEGLPAAGTPMPQAWLSPDTRVEGQAVLLLGPEPIIGPQAVVLGSAALPGRRLRVATDGVRPFTARDPEAP